MLPSDAVSTANSPSHPASDWRAKVDALFAPRAKGKENDTPPSSSSVHSIPSSFFSNSILRQFLFFCVCFFLVGVLAMFIAPSLLPPPSWKMEVIESPLYKNARLNFTPGDYLLYGTTSPAGSQLIRLDAELVPGCPGIRLTDSNARQMVQASLANPRGSGITDPALSNAADAYPTSPSTRALSANSANPSPLSASSYSVCLGYDGVERSPSNQRLGSNLSFSSITWPYFQPWMLAVRENWSWSARTVMHIQPFNINYTQDIVYRTLNLSTYGGREAYWVEISYPLPANSPVTSSPVPPVVLAIDAERRVLAYSESENVSIALVDASFFDTHLTE